MRGLYSGNSMVEILSVVSKNVSHFRVSCKESLWEVSMARRQRMTALHYA